jgi:hypothetical protein
MSAPDGDANPGAEANPDADGDVPQAGASTAPCANGHRASARGHVLQRLAELLRSQGGMLAGLVSEDGQARRAGGGDLKGPAQLAALGPRASADPGEYELLLEAIYEGYLLHYATPRLVHVPEADLALLAGDQLYALGLARLVSLGDSEAVSELADVITLCSVAHGAGLPDLAEAVWQAGARAIGWGPTPSHAQAKALARSGSSEALAAMRAAAAPRL